MRRNKPACQPQNIEAPALVVERPKMNINPMAVATAGVKPNSNPSAALDFSLQQTFSLPSVPKGVIPQESKVTMDSAFTPFQEFGYDSIFAEGLGFLGYSYLAQLSQRAEYRKPAEIVAEYMIKNWLEFKGVGDDDKTEKIKQLEDEFKRLHVKDAFAKAAELDCYYGRSQIFIDTGNQEPAELITKLATSPTKIRKNGIKKLKVVEPYWTYPNDYNSTNPLADDFFVPTSWFVMGQSIHTTRFLNFVARPVSDILKPVYNFGGLSLTQIMKPYVDNWLRTRQSVSDLLYSFSINVLKTNMGSILSGGGGEDVGLRVDIFNKYRDNRGCFVLDKDTEDFINVSAPLGTIDKLQAQSQEQMASVAGIPFIILLKITPSGLNASSEGEIRTFNDWIESQQVSLFGPQMDRLLPMIQLSLWGEIDKDITYKWITLNPKDEIADANRRKVEADTDAVYIQEGVIDTLEARTRLAKQEDSPYAGLDLSIVPEPPQASEEEAGGLEELLMLEQAKIPGMDAEFKEEDHPRQDDGKFGQGTGNKRQKLTMNEKSALSSYSGDDFLRINSSLRSGKLSPDDQKQVERIDSAIQKSDLKPGTTLYRGLTKEAAKKLLGDQINKGAVFSDSSFASTSSDQWIANVLGGVKLKIEVGNNCKGLDMSKHSNNPQEKETLLPRNAKMQILGIIPPKSPGQPVTVRVKYGD